MYKIEDFFLGVLQGRPPEELEKYRSNFDSGDWRRLRELSVKNGLFPSFYKRLVELKLENLPEEFISSLRSLYLVNLSRNLILETKMLDIMSFFRVNGIAAIPLKGPFMARYIYGDLDLRRTSTDIDFLIPKEHFKETVAKLKEAGYYLPDDKPDDDRHYRFRREVPLLKKDGGDILRLELHWDLRDAFTSTHIEEFWAGARNIDYNGIRIMAPSDEDLILYLALKSVFVFDTNFIDIRYLFDIHNMVSKFRDKIDWNVLSQKSRRFGTNVHMSYAFKYSCDFFGTRIPDSLLIRLEDTGFKPRLLKSKIDKEKILWSSSNVRSSYTWYFLTSSYLFSDNLLGFLKSIWRKMRRAARLYLSCEI